MIRMIPAIESNTSPSECNFVGGDDANGISRARDVRGKALDEAVDALMAKLRRPGNEDAVCFSALSILIAFPFPSL